MKNINFNDYKAIFFENGEIVFKGKKDDSNDLTHGDIIEEYIDFKLNDEKFKDNPYLNRLKKCNANMSMAAQVLYFTDAVVLLNTGTGSYLMFKEDVDPSNLDIIKYYKDDIESLGNCYLYKIGLVHDQNSSYIIDELIEDDITLPLDLRIDNYFKQNQIKGRK